MGITRRDFLKVSGITGGTATAPGLLSKYETLVAAGPDMAQQTIEQLIPTTCWIGKQ
ncbi:MAG: twin-arginine translocation signal domain-containing protein, partial [Anaerolineales bacterium]|nr:twin-arginine translocation signal domain-containing protein [Anaerolineales bacterium]